MSDRKKRKPNHSNYDDNKNQRRRLSNGNTETTNRDDLVIYRILCPAGFIGGVIGKGGKVINATRDSTKAKIKVFDQLPGCTQRVITIYSSVKDKQLDVTAETEEIEPLCCAQDALLRVHDTIVSCVDSSSSGGEKKKKECRLLVPSSQASCVIGKAGSVIKSIRRRRRASVEVVSKDASDPSHACALDFDNVVLITGEAESVKKALYAVSTTMYKTNPREQIPLDSSTVQETASTVVIPPEISSYVYPQTGLYTNHDHRASVPTFVNASDLQGYAAETTSMHVTSPVSKELVLKVLCPVSNIGRVIGKEGSTINGMREASGSRIEVNKANHGGDDECVIIVTATESPDDMKSMAVEAILLLQEKINDEEDEETVKMQLLVPSKAVGCVIGKNGSVITQIRKRTNASIRISKGNVDDLVEVSGEVSSVRNALIQIVLRLREDVLGDRGGSVSARNHPPARSDHSGFALPPFVSSVPEYASSVDFDQRRETTGESSLGMVSSDRFYGYESFPVRSDIESRDHGLGSVGPYSYGGGLYQSSALEILVPANAVSKVIGKGGGNLENIRRISGAMVEVSDSKTSLGDRIALVSGTPEQMRSAENLFQAFIMST